MSNTDMSGWISVEDGPPELGERVLVFGDTMFGPIQFIDEWIEITEAPVSFSSQTIVVGVGWADSDPEEITHWMPLPPNPSIGE